MPRMRKREWNSIPFGSPPAPLTPHSAGSYTYVIDFSGFWHFEVFCSSDVILRVSDGRDLYTHHILLPLSFMEAERACRYKGFSLPVRSCQLFDPRKTSGIFKLFRTFLTVCRFIGRSDWISSTKICNWNTDWLLLLKNLILSLCNSSFSADRSLLLPIDQTRTIPADDDNA